MGGDPIAVVRARNEAAGVDIDARQSMPGWLGERLDVVYAIDVLRPCREAAVRWSADSPWEVA